MYITKILRLFAYPTRIDSFKVTVLSRNFGESLEFYLGKSWAQDEANRMNTFLKFIFPTKRNVYLGKPIDFVKGAY